jgi:hypothetical protein
MKLNDISFANHMTSLELQKLQDINAFFSPNLLALLVGSLPFFFAFFSAFFSAFLPFFFSLELPCVAQAMCLLVFFFFH